MTDAKFPNPFEVKAVSGTQGWERMYPYYYLFSSERRQYEENRFWFFDAMHHPEPMYPFDTITAEAWWVALSQNTSRIFAIPPALGIAHRIVNGYVYISAHGVEDPQQIAERAAYFEKRAGYYFEHWDELYAKWEIKFRGVIGELKSIEVPRLPAYEPEEVVTEGRGISSGYPEPSPHFFSFSSPSPISAQLDHFQIMSPLPLWMRSLAPFFVARYLLGYVYSDSLQDRWSQGHSGSRAVLYL